MAKVHGSPFSVPTLRVVTTLHEKELDFEFMEIDLMTDVHKQEPYLSLNPFGQVPAFEDGDHVKIFESRAITRYISFVYHPKGTPLLNKDASVTEIAALAVWLEVEAHQFDPVASKLNFELTYKKYMKMEVDTSVVEEYETKLAKVLDVYEDRLSKYKYIGSDTFSLADLHHIPTIHYLYDTQVKRLFDERPHVSAWCQDIFSRPSWQKSVGMLNEALQKFQAAI